MHMPAAYAINSQSLERNAYTHQQELILVDEYPERAGQPECSYFLKTGNCKYRPACKFHHPKSATAKPPPCSLSDLGLPLRLIKGAWDTAPDGRFAWGYCYKEEVGAAADYCVASDQWPCVPGRKYFGRGPFQISYNFNYGPVGQALGLDLLSNPELVSNDSVISFKTALWFLQAVDYGDNLDIFGIDYGDNLDCYNQSPFGFGSARFWSII